MISSGSKDGTAPATLSTVAAEHSPKRRFVFNVAWGWVGVAVNVGIGVVISPILIRRLGVSQYGLWVWLFSVIDYMRLLDFGFRAAVVNRCARCRARGDWAGISRIQSTALAYFGGVATIGGLLVIVARGPIVRLMGLAPADALPARSLVVLIAITVTLRLAISPLVGMLEAFQRFDTVNHIYICTLMARALGSLAVLLAGYGLVAMACIVLAAHAAESVATFARVRAIAPQLRLRIAAASNATLRELFRYGRYSALISSADLVTLNAPAVVLGSLRSAAEVGYFSLPFRLLMYTAEAAEKVASVTTSVSAAFDELGNRAKVFSLAATTNRHCFALFMPLAIFLLVYGSPLLHRWVTADMAENGGRVLPILVVSYLFAVSGQNNASAVLIGQGRHAAYAYGTVVEAISMIGLLIVFVPTFGIIGAAWVVTTVLLAIRGVFVAAAFCHENGFRFGEYMRAVYVPGLSAGIPTGLFAIALRSIVWPGRSWGDLILAGGTLSAVYVVLSLFTTIEPGNRLPLLRSLWAHMPWHNEL